MKHTYTIEPDDWNRLMDVCREARATPVMLVGGVDISASAHERVNKEWKHLGAKYGFVWDSAEGGDVAAHTIMATPVEAAPEKSNG